MFSKFFRILFSTNSIIYICFNLPAFAQSAISEIPLDQNKQSVASLWVSQVLNAVSSSEGSFVGPTGSSRAYGILSTAMYDTWSAFEQQPTSALYLDGVIDFDLQRPQAENTLINKQEAISYAAFRVLNDLFTAPNLQASFTQKMLDLGLNPHNDSLDLTTPSGIGNFVAQQWLNFRHQDGSNQLNNYADTSGYLPVNTVNNITDINAWTPESIPIGSEGTPEYLYTQRPLTPHWGSVTPFALTNGNQYRPPAPVSFLLDPLATVDLGAKTITRADNTVVPISRNLIGTDINPQFIAQAEQIIALSASLSDPNAQVEGDTRKIIAEFWEDQRGTPFPAGTWMLFAQKVAEKDNPNLDFDIPLFLNVGNAVFDAGIATWESKYFHNYTRPVRAIRELGELGLIGEDADGDGIFTVNAWGGVGLGTREIPVTDFITYQLYGGDPSPPFPEYTSGHSAFSAATAEVLKLYTGSDTFILGDGSVGLSVNFPVGSSRFEPSITPQSPITLSWLTFSDAANEAGISRLYGGIHFQDGDLNARSLGRQVGQNVFSRTQLLLNGGKTVPEPSSTLSLIIFSGLLWLLDFGKKKAKF